jgi:diaminopimelate epimerase
MRTIPFTKMHGLGNDYIYVNVIENPLDDPSALSVLWSDRHKGIGSDGLILIGPSDKADFSMRIFNADGSEAQMCGNGSRCVGRYIHDKGLSDKTVIKLETLSGIKVLNLHLDRKGQVRDVTVDMGKGLPLEVVLPDGSRGQWILEDVFACGKRFRGTAVDVGNPHLVLFVPDAESAPVAEAGPLFEKDVMFPHRANIEFAQVLDERHIRMRVWERGSGITQACGTGACATAVAAAMAGYTRPDGCTIIMDGGLLDVSWDPDTKEIRMTGTATTVFEGTIELEND